MPLAAADLTGHYIQMGGAGLYCLVFLYLWRQSGIVYFGFWSLAWAGQLAAQSCVFMYVTGGRVFWLGPYAFFEFSFALLLMAAARSRPGAVIQSWKSIARVLLGFPLFLVIVYLLGIQSSFEGFQSLHALILGSIYFFSFLTMRGSWGIGALLFRFSLLSLAVLFLHHSIMFFYLFNQGKPAPPMPKYLQYTNLYDFALHALLALSAMAMWIENQRDRIYELAGELDGIRRENAKNMDLDRLTGLLNQSALERRLENADGFMGVVAVCDMDNFKNVNDRYGHLVGDEILRNIGNLLRSSVRPEDEAYRWGGDEFVILFRNQRAPVVNGRMHEIRQRLIDFRVRGYGVIPISFSWGTAESNGDALRKALEVADKDMYSSKRMRDQRPEE